MEEHLHWKLTFDWRQSSLEDKNWWKTTYDRGQPSTKDNLTQKTHNNKRTSMLDNLGLKMTSYKKLYDMGDEILLFLYNDPNFSSSIVTKFIGLLKDSFYSMLSFYYKHDKLNEWTDWVTLSFHERLTSDKNTVFRSSCLINKKLQWTVGHHVWLTLVNLLLLILVILYSFLPRNAA